MILLDIIKEKQDVSQENNVDKYFINYVDKIIELAGVGTFGKVFTCEALNKREDIPDIVAIKVIRDVSKYTEEAKVEHDVWERILKCDKSEDAHIVKLY